MAGLIFTAEVTAYAVSTSGAKTALAITAPTNQRVKILGWSFDFDGVTGTFVPVTVELVEFTAGGAGTATSGTGSKTDQSLPETVQTTVKNTYTVEPSTANPLITRKINPTTGYGEAFPYGQEIICPGGKMIGIRMLSANAVNAYVTLRCEE